MDKELMDIKTEIDQLTAKLLDLKNEIAKVIVGQEETVDQLMIAFLAGGHALLEGVPGLAKTLMIKTLAQEGMTMVIVTHEMAFAREVATRILFMDEGEILEDTSPEDFFTQPSNPRARAFLSKLL